MLSSEKKDFRHMVLEAAYTSSNALKELLIAHREEITPEIINEYSKSGWTPFLRITADLDRQVDSDGIKSTILLLEAGASPHAACKREPPGNYTAIHAALNDFSLSRAKLLLWYDPAYEDVRNNYRQDITAADRVKKLDAHYFRGFKAEIERTVVDSKNVIRLAQEVKAHSEQDQHKDAAIKCEEIAALFFRHQNFEKTYPARPKYEKITYSDYDGSARRSEETEDANPFIDFYQNKRMLFCEKAFTAYQRYLDTVGNFRKESKEERLLIITKLADLATVLKNRDVAIQYAAMAAQLIAELHPALLSSAPYDTPMPSPAQQTRDRSPARLFQTARRGTQSEEAQLRQRLVSPDRFVYRAVPVK